MNVAIIGCGTLGRIQSQMAVNCGLDVVVCADISAAPARALAKHHNAKSTTKCMAAARRRDVDIVVVTTPTQTHSQYVVAAAQAGKHVFCEKPFGRTLRQCKDALAAVKKAKVKLFVGHVVRYFREFEAMKTQIDAGVVGDVGFVKTFRGGGAPRGANGWFRDFEMSGGATLDLIIHDFDWLRYVFGDVERVFSQDRRDKIASGIDHALVTLRMKNGVIANVVGSWAMPSGFYVTAEVCGEKGMIQFDSRDAAVQSMKRQPAGGQTGTIVPASPQEVSPYQLEWEDFLRDIEGAGTPRVTPQDALEAVRVSLAALKSAETGKPVTLASARP